MSRFDVVIFGATGFTGKFVVREWIKNYNATEKLSWSIAGRSKEKLVELIDQLSNEFSKMNLYFCLLS